MVLCAGLGTRLRPLTEWLPKPAVPVCGLPLVRYALARLAAAGAGRAVVNVHHLAAVMEAAARDSAAALGLQLDVSREPVIAGTGGALRQARAFLDGADPVVLWNGDVLYDLDLGPVLLAHRQSGALATMVLAPMPPGGGYAAVEVDRNLVVRRIAGRGPGGPGLEPLHFTGVHVLSPGLLQAVPAEPFACDVNRDVYPPLLLQGLVRGHVGSGAWNDLGTPARYLQANLDLLSGVIPLARLRGADPFAGLEPSGGGVWLAPGTRVEPGAALEGPALLGPGSHVEAGAAVGPRAVVGSGCRVAAGARVLESVLWDATSLAPGEVLEGVVAAGRERVAARV
ncbi:MAG TPA: NDP-sugar synthase [Anaeromyxobacteraceae bacterium]|nr:NDP-sugar synthase [Anaeromyxobacteraceae bacterium]